MKKYHLLMPAGQGLDIKTLNNVAVEYIGLGLQDLSYQIWDELFHEIQCSPRGNTGLLPVISCNMGNVLRRTGYYEEAYRICRQGLKRCFGTGVMEALPELVLQLSILSMELGNTEDAKSLYSFGQNILRWSKKSGPAVEPISIEEMKKRDILLYC